VDHAAAARKESIINIETLKILVVIHLARELTRWLKIQLQFEVEPIVFLEKARS
jgi:hypothetical protein